MFFWRQNVHLLVVAIVEVSNTFGLSLVGLLSLANELEELGLVRREVWRIYEDLPQSIDVLTLDSNGVVATEDNKLQKLEELIDSIVMVRST